MKRAALAAVRAAHAALGSALDALEASMRDDGDTLVTLADGWSGLTGSTLARWARTGRLVAYEAERGRLVAWSSDLRRAIEAAPCKSVVNTSELDAANDSDAFDQALASGELRRGAR